MIYLFLTPLAWVNLFTCFIYWCEFWFEVIYFWHALARAVTNWCLMLFLNRRASFYGVSCCASHFRQWCILIIFVLNCRLVIQNIKQIFVCCWRMTHYLPAGTKIISKFHCFSQRGIVGSGGLGLRLHNHLIVEG